MSFFSRYINGDWNAICDVCGRKYKNTLLKQRWDGLMCCPQDWEIRQPQDFVRGVPDPQLVPWVRDEATDSYLDIVIAYFNTWVCNVTPTLIVTPQYHNNYKTVSVLVSSTCSIQMIKIPAIANVATTINGDTVNAQYLG